MITAHADVVGSLLRPPELLKAQKDLAAGLITKAQLKTIEDRVVDDARGGGPGGGHRWGDAPVVIPEPDDPSR